MASLNKVILMGNLTADVELKTTPSGVSVCSFSIAVGRRLSKEQQVNPDAVKTDFINIVAWRNTAEFISRYFSKGKSIVVVGSLQVRNYTAQDGSKRYVTEVVADEVTFGGLAAPGNVGNDTKCEHRSPTDRPTPNGVTGYFEDKNENVNIADAEFVEVGSEDDLPF
jgi:single-strand DNA-binding protein